MKEINPNLDPVSHVQMFEIVAREAIEELENKLKDHLKFVDDVAILLSRVNALDGARKIQIQLNEGIRKALVELGKVPKIEIKEEKPKWRFW